MPNIKDKLTKDGYEPRLDEITESLLKAVQRVVREEIERVLGPNSITHSKHLEDAPAVSPRAISKAEAALILGVSLRTIDECITFKYIGVIRVGHRVLVPMKSLDRVLKRWPNSTRTSG